ncbi:MAG: hypothetical protein RLP02_32765 [Coleofasciculus sp. C2-GNP5-27]
MLTKSKLANYTLFLFITLISYTSFIVKSRPSFGQIEAERVEQNEQKSQSTPTQFLVESLDFAQGAPPANLNASAIPEAVKIVSDGTQLQWEWQGETYSINVNELNVRLMDSVDPATYNPTEKVMTGQRFVRDSISVDPETGNIAVGVVLDYFAATNFSAVFIIDPQPGAYAIYRVQVPGSQPLPDEFSTYSLDTIDYVRFLDGDLLIKHGDASGTTALLVFKPANTPAMDYSGCVDLQIGESRSVCPRNK